MKAKLIVLLVFPLLLVGCGTSRRAQNPPVPATPEWVMSRPVSPTYYYGVGVARKSTDVNQYQQAARHNALADMAGEISISISTNSVLNSFEWNFNIREDFTSTIRTHTQQELDGYEQVGTWEDAGSYWVYYRLSRSHHKELMERKRSNAVARSLDIFSSAIDARDAGNIRLALVLMVKALEPIKPYFSEPLAVDFRGVQIFLANEIFRELSVTLSNTRIVPAADETTVKKGQGLTGLALGFTVRYGQQVNIAEIPVLAAYSEKPIRNSRKRTGADGRVGFDIDVVTSGRPSETLTASLDFDAIVGEGTTDLMIRRMVLRFAAPQATIRINVQKPKFLIVAREINMGEAITPGMLTESFRNRAIEGGYLITDRLPDADFIVRINAEARDLGQTGGFRNALIEGSLSVENQQGVQIYHRPLEGFTRRHFQEMDAGLEAFREVRRRLEGTYFREIHEAITRR